MKKLPKLRTSLAIVSNLARLSLNSVARFSVSSLTRLGCAFCNASTILAGLTLAGACIALNSLITWMAMSTPSFNSPVAKVALPLFGVTLAFLGAIGSLTTGTNVRLFLSRSKGAKS